MSELSCDTLHAYMYVFIGRNETHDLSRYQRSLSFIVPTRPWVLFACAARSDEDLASSHGNQAPHSEPPLCSAHNLSPVPALALRVQPSAEQRRPPPWRRHRPLQPTADLSQPGSTQRLPPPCLTHRPWIRAADFGQPCTEHRWPPPCPTQNNVLPRADLMQFSCAQRRPPPWLMQRGSPLSFALALPTAERGHPSMPQRWPPPCATQRPLDPRAERPHPSN
jgi:hypothetical protein